jgi:hypothetical protein
MGGRKNSGTCRNARKKKGMEKCDTVKKNMVF